MGIPSYYKRLIDRFPRLVQRGVQNLGADVLLMDFNCLIYQCTRGDNLPRYTTDTRAEWEKAVIEAVKVYTVKVWTAAGRPGRVFIGVDGVVPMAKIRQQRLRRFKSRWLAAAEMEAGARKPGEEVWDTNAITPGTEFMEKLAGGLRSLATARGTGWAVSAADEPGEGEQKLMGWVRSRTDELAGKQVVVYGLDADLIVLSLLGVAREVPTVSGWKLLRELAEFEGARAGEAFGALDVVELLGVLCPSGMTRADYMLEYVCGMSFLGNDFLPHSLSVRMREGGHDTMCRTLAALHAADLRLVRNGKVQRDACLELVRAWAVEEEGNMMSCFSQKYKMRPMAPRNERERLMRHVENLPLEWKAEELIWSKMGLLLPGWHETYYRSWMHEARVGQVCAEYTKGLQWIIDYYLGKPVSYSWYFPWSLPPLWGDLVGALDISGSVDLVAPEPSSPVAPQEQLAMVLPLDSWWLVRDLRLRTLPAKAPIYWPKSFGFFSVGKRWLWECEAEVPIITVERLKQIIRP